MSQYRSISQIADEVLASVFEEARQKTASATPSVEAKTQIPAARALRKLAEDLRTTPDEEEVMPEDLEALLSDPQVAELLMELEKNPELLEAILADEGADGPPMDGPPMDGPPMDAPPDGPPDAAAGPPGAPPFPPGPPKKDKADKDEDEDEEPAPSKKAASASFDLRKVAADLRAGTDHTRRRKLIKTAATLNAATGIQHLLRGKS